jgi:hypothetical protein
LSNKLEVNEDLRQKQLVCCTTARTDQRSRSGGGEAKNVACSWLSPLLVPFTMIGPPTLCSVDDVEKVGFG